MTRQIVLDTETTGLEPSQGHRIIEIGCVELIDRKLTGRHYHQYINPNRVVEEEAIGVHGITNEYLVDKPYFHQIAAEFLEFVRGSELIIHNAPFDVGFIDHEFRMLNPQIASITGVCGIIDTLVMARQKHRARGIISMRFVSVMGRITLSAICTALYLIPRFWPMFIC